MTAFLDSEILSAIMMIDACRKSVANVLYSKPLRKIFTSNFRSGLLAFGENYNYFFPPRWVMVDWRNADFDFFLKPGSKLPLEDQSQEVVYAAHLIEHLDDATLTHFVSECARILKPGGYVRFEAPDAEFLVRSYVQRDQKILDYFNESYQSFYRGLSPARRKKFEASWGDMETFFEPHVGIAAELCCYIDSDFDGAHTPIPIPRKEFEARLGQSLEELNVWLQGHKTTEQLLSGGHNNLIYFSKMEKIFREQGFSDVWKSSEDQSKIPAVTLNHKLRRFYDSIPVKLDRAFYSLYVEARR